MPPLKAHVPVSRQTICAPGPILKSLTIKLTHAVSNADLTAFDLAFGHLVPILAGSQTDLPAPLKPKQASGCLPLDSRT